jgi:RNA binding exosome subunit
MILLRELEVRFDLSAALLEEFKTLASDDLVKTDLELTHLPCGKRLCDVEAGDTMTELLAMVAAHVCGEDGPWTG